MSRVLKGVADKQREPIILGVRKQIILLLHGHGRGSLLIDSHDLAAKLQNCFSGYLCTRSILVRLNFDRNFFHQINSAQSRPHCSSERYDPITAILKNESVYLLPLELLASTHCVLALTANDNRVFTDNADNLRHRPPPLWQRLAWPNRFPPPRRFPRSR